MGTPWIPLLLSLVLLSYPPTQTAQNLHTTTYNFTSFDRDASANNFTVLGDAGGLNGGSIQVTPDTINQVSYLINKSGRVMLSQPFKLYHPINNTYNHVASFNTTFDINIFRPNNTLPGEGLAFLIAPNLSAPPAGSFGGYLGLTNSATDGNPSNKFVAVEFDTVKQSYDPDVDHVGLDINSVKSNLTASLSDVGIELSPVKAANYTIWIDYDGGSKRLSVYITNESDPKPANPVLSTDIDISKYVAQQSYFGFSASTGTDYELNCVLKWELTVEVLPKDGGGLSGGKLAAVIAGAAVAVLVVVGLIVGGLLVLRRRWRIETNILGALRSLPGTPREFRYVELKKATNNFDEKNKLGEGGFGIVYKGVLAKENAEVAVKQFSREKLKGKSDFLAELTIINRLRHKHLVRLVGWCHKNGTLMLVYDYMPNGSLDTHLYGNNGMKPLEWDRRYTILAGVASALHYLHDEYDKKVVHRDLKASNVLLDSHFNARLGDFGLARALDNEKTSYMEDQGFAGTPGYIAPECFHTQKATRESDVFGFGVVILEVVCGQRPYGAFQGGFKYLSDWVWTLYREGRILDAVDKKLDGEFVAEDAERLLLLGLACSHPIAVERPKMQEIAQIIYRSVPPPAVPRIKPSFIWPMVESFCFDDNSFYSNTATTTATTTERTSSSNYA